MRHALLLMTIGIAGCDAARFDATNDEAVQASMKRLTAGMSKEEKDDFLRDCYLCALSDASQISFAAANPGNGKATLQEPFKDIDGLTVAEIRAKARAVMESKPKQ